MSKKLFFGVSIAFNVVTIGALGYVASLEVPERFEATLIRYVTNASTAALSAPLPIKEVANP